jgi:hypothetical protein
MQTTSPMAEVFETCGKLRSSFFAIEEGVDEVREISMNASVSVCQTGINTHSFNEIAHQISRIAGRMQVSLIAGRQEMNNIIGLTLQAYIIEKRRDKLLEARPYIDGEENQKLFDDVLYNWSQSITRLMFDVIPRIHRSNALLSRIRHHLYLLFAAINALKVESTELVGDNEAVVLSLAEQLMDVHEAEFKKLDLSFSLLHKIRKSAQAIVLDAQQHKEAA